jgi:hypothetical protein
MERTANVRQQQAADARDRLAAAAALANHIAHGDPDVDLLVGAIDVLVDQAQRELHRRALRLVS